MWSTLLILVGTLAAAFWICCSCLNAENSIKHGDIIKTSQRLRLKNRNKTWSHFNIHLSALRLLGSVCLGMLGFLAEFGDVLDHLWRCAGNNTHFLWQDNNNVIITTTTLSVFPPTCLKASPSSSLPAFWASFSKAADLLALFFTLIRQDSRQTSRRKTSRPKRAMMATYSDSSL